MVYAIGLAGQNGMPEHGGRGADPRGRGGMIPGGVRGLGGRGRGGDADELQRKPDEGCPRLPRRPAAATSS